MRRARWEYFGGAHNTPTKGQPTMITLTAIFLTSTLGVAVYKWKFAKNKR